MFIPTALTNEDHAALAFRSMHGRHVGRDQYAGNLGDRRDFEAMLSREYHRADNDGINDPYSPVDALRFGFPAPTAADAIEWRESCEDMKRREGAWEDAGCPR